jgi:DNA-binding transcriptional MocR family regulator
MEWKVDRFRDERELAELLGDWSVGRGPLYSKLVDRVQRAMDAGDLLPGDRLPSERQLAAALAVSRSTIVAAYDELRARGALTSRQGSGTRVSMRVRPRTPSVDGRIPGGRATAIFRRLIDGPGDAISLTCAAEAGIPEVGDALRDLVREDLPTLLADPGYHPRGLLSLREAVAANYTRAGLPTSADEVLVTTGAQQAIGLAAELYVRGGTILVEAPSWPGSLDVFRAAGATLVGVPLDDEGIRADALADALARHAPRLLYVQPTFHNPTGIAMSLNRRRQVAELVARHDVPVLEDNAYVALAQPDGVLPPPLASYVTGAAEVLTLGSLGKLLWGGLRTGWVRAPAEIIERLARRKVLADLGSPILDQALGARLVPLIPDLLVSRNKRFGEQLDVFERELREQLPGWRWRRPDGGAGLWVELPGVDAGVFAQVALRHGVEIVPGSAMDPDGAHNNFIRVPFTFSPSVLSELVRRLARAWSELERHGPVEARSLTPII